MSALAHPSAYLASTDISTLSPSHVVDLRDRLERQREFRDEQISALQHHERSSPLGATDPDVSRSLMVAAYRALHEIRLALARMDDGSYGICESCGGAVGSTELDVYPQAAQCMPCRARALERPNRPRRASDGC